MILLLLLFPALFLFLFHQLFWKRRHLPPGPCPIPFIGNWVSMAFPMPGYECFRQWTKRYGDVYTFWLGSEPYVIIGSYHLIKDTFIKDPDTYMDKKPQEFQREFRGGDFGVVETNGQVWREHRRFALHQLRNFGFGKDLMQQKILIEVEEMFGKYDEKLGVEQNVPKIMDQGVANVINQLLFGYRFDEEKGEEYRKIQELLDDQQTKFTRTKVLVECFLPFLSQWMPKPTIKDLIEEYKTAFYSFFNSQIDEHRQKINLDSDSTSDSSEDYAEAYLKEQRKRESEGDFESFSTQQLSNMCLDQWVAGLTTTTLTLSWIIGYLMNTPGIQEKVHEELDKVIGSDRLVTTADKNNLPYMNAFINESQRCANIIPLNLFHATTRDTVIGGFPIPKGTGVIAQISTVMLDEKVFPDPYTFNPDRFIENGKLRKVEELVPFSVGKRQCLGEGLARMELFLFISNFFNRYEILPSSSGPPSIDKTLEFGVAPRKFHAILQKRHVFPSLATFG